MWGWDKLCWSALLLGGIGIAVYAVTAEQFTFERRGLFPGAEKERYAPKWYHRAGMALIGFGISASGVCPLFGLHCQFLKIFHKH